MKAVVTDINSIPEPVRGEYEEKDGAFYLRLEGTPGFVPATELATTNEKLAEFRNNNVSLLKEKQQLELRLKSLEGIDPIEYSKTKKEIEELRARPQAPDVQRAVDAAVGPIQSRLDEMARREQDAQAKAAAAEARAAQKQLESELQTVGARLGILPEAMTDYVRRGTETFMMENGSPVAKRNGVPVFSRLKGNQPLNVEEWATDLAQEAPHLFRASTGGGAPGSRAAGSGNGAVPARVIKNDLLEIGKNLEDVASGKTRIDGWQ
jgi:hypothetical protein